MGVQMEMDWKLWAVRLFVAAVVYAAVIIAIGTSKSKSDNLDAEHNWPKRRMLYIQAILAAMLAVLIVS